MKANCTQIVHIIHPNNEIANGIAPILHDPGPVIKPDVRVELMAYFRAYQHGMRLAHFRNRAENALFQ